MTLAMRRPPGSRPVWTKICGLTSVEDARAVASFRPDAIGLNFSPLSKRHVTIDTAREIAAVLPKPVEIVGVFVNHSADEILAIAEAVGLDAIQLHGDETPELARKLSLHPVIRAMRVGEDGLAPVADELASYAANGITLQACLVDAHVAGTYGGTGKTAPWELLREWPDEWPPMILAGGLTPDNVSDAVRLVRPFGVDVASGVESRPGVKDLKKVERFLEQSRSVLRGR